MHPSLLLSLPSLLNASLTATPTVSTPAPRHSTVMYCWPEDVPPEYHLLPTTFLACREAMKKIPLNDAGLKPLTFGRSASSGFQVPHTFDGGMVGIDCAVEIDVVEEDVTATATFAELVIAAFDLAAGCVIPKPHLGGRTILDEHSGAGGLKVWMYGYHNGPAVER